VREASTQGGLLLANPFTTEPQDGRYLLLLQWGLGRLAAPTGMNPFTVLELSRVPLLALMLLALWRLTLVAVHPYSAIVVLAVAVIRPVLARVVQVPGGGAGAALAAAGLLPAVPVAIVLSAWQNGDAVYRATAGNVLGPQALSILWYPVTLGVTGVLAVRGWRDWIAEADPCVLPMAAWTLAVVFLHTSPVLNGYHFVFYLYTSISLAAAPALVRTWDALRARRWGLVGAGALAVLLFQAPLSLTRKCLAELELHRIHPSSAKVLDLLAGAAGPVLAPAEPEISSPPMARIASMSDSGSSRRAMRSPPTRPWPSRPDASAPPSWSRSSTASASATSWQPRRRRRLSRARSGHASSARWTRGGELAVLVLTGR
jgi:hypothetical protein